MASTPTRLMTFAEFEKLPRTKQGFPYELRHGVVVYRYGELAQMAPPKMPHARLQVRLRRLVERAAGESMVVKEEMAFRPLPEHEFRVADIGLVSVERWDAAGEYLMGAPELVIEVLSPSNSLAEMREKRRLCLENGSREFWVADWNQREGEISTPDGRSVTYRAGQEISLFFALGKSIAVDAIFA